jgi:lycopene cyclase domain-containing protein
VNYTATAIGAVLGAVGFDLLLARTRLLTRRAFWTSYAIMLGFQLLVNGILTGLHVVRYDRHRIIGPRIVYAPVEDLLFGFAMVLVTLSTWVLLGRRAARATPAEDR